MTQILQTKLPYDLSAQRPLPGIQPLDMAEWLHVDEAYLGQMAYRGQLIAEKRDKVIGLLPEAEEPAAELLDLVLSQLASRPDFTVSAETVLRPDGQRVQINRNDPMATLGHLVQEDLCILQKQGDAQDGEQGGEHVLTGAVLCFPSSWTLAQKLGKPLIAIHVPVDEYDANLAKRVQRLFDGVRLGRPLWRFNILWYGVSELHYPRPEFDHREWVSKAEASFLRSEKQCILRLPQTGAAVFSIHTFMLEGDLGRALAAGPVPVAR